LENLRLAVMSVVRNRGKVITEDDFVNYFSYTKNWIAPDYARKLFRICLDANLLKKSGSGYTPNFEFTGMIPLDFKLTEAMVDKYTVQDEVFTVMLDRICNEKGIGRKEVLMHINRIKKEAKYITIEVATLIYCKIENINCTDYYKTVEKRLVV